MSSKKSNTRQAGRSAKTGKFISVKTARRHPSTTVVETIKNPSRRPKSPKKQ